MIMSYQQQLLFKQQFFNMWHKFLLFKTGNDFKNQLFTMLPDNFMLLEKNCYVSNYLFLELNNIRRF